MQLAARCKTRLQFDSVIAQLENSLVISATRGRFCPMIAVQDLTKYYGSFVAIEHISFEIQEGQVVALIGPNGAGKTTIMRILTGYVAPSAGTARIHGFDVERHRLAAAACVGYLPENGPLYPDMTPVQLLQFWGRARKVANDLLVARIERVADHCDIRAILDKPIGRLSKGLRQRVGVALALLHDPPVLIMDEPTSGLDPNQIREFRDLVCELRKQKTILISTHVLQEVEAIAERILLIHDGTLMFDGSTSEAALSGSLEEFFYRCTQKRASEVTRSAHSRSPVRENLRA